MGVWVLDVRQSVGVALTVSMVVDLQLLLAPTPHTHTLSYIKCFRNDMTYTSIMIISCLRKKENKSITICSIDLYTSSHFALIKRVTICSSILIRIRCIRTISLVNLFIYTPIIIKKIVLLSYHMIEIFNFFGWCI